MWQGVEYTAASGGMEEAIKNYCKKETGEPLLFFLGKCTKISAGLLPQEITGIFSMKKDMTQISMSYLLLVRRKGMSKPPVKLGVDKSYLIEKERTS